MSLESPEISKLVIKGHSGQGIQLLGLVLARLLVDQEYQVALSSSYSPLVRSGKSSIFLVFSKKSIKNPLVETADLSFDLSDKELSTKLLSAYQNSRTLNMALLGLILKTIDVKPTIVQLKRHLPEKWQAMNLEAIKSGFAL